MPSPPTGQSLVNVSALIFGPNPNLKSNETRVNDILQKRQDIRDYIRKQGHIADFPEDILPKTAEGPLGNAFHQEMLLVSNYDVVISLVESPGTIGELNLLSLKPAENAKKARLFVCEDHQDGFVAQACEFLTNFGADYATFKYPEDITECKLLGMVRHTIERIQILKYYTD